MPVPNRQGEPSLRDTVFGVLFIKSLLLTRIAAIVGCGGGKPTAVFAFVFAVLIWIQTLREVIRRRRVA